MENLVRYLILILWIALLIIAVSCSNTEAPDQAQTVSYPDSLRISDRFYTIGEVLAPNGPIPALILINSMEWHDGQDSWNAQMSFDTDYRMNLYSVCRWPRRGPIIVINPNDYYRTK